MRHSRHELLAEGLSDLRYSARSLARTPGLAFALLLTIALGVGANASVYGFVRGLITPDLPIAGFDRVVSLFTRDKQGALLPVSYEEYVSLGASADVFESLGAARESRVRLAAGSRSVTVAAAAVTAEISSLLQIPLRGGIAISDRLRRTEFGASTDVGGVPVRIDGADTHVGGLAPDWLAGLYSGRLVEVWAPLRADDIRGPDRSSLTFSVIGRLRAGVSVEEAQKAVNAVREDGAVAVLPYTGLTPEAATGISRLATLLPAAAGAVFLIACANIAAFLLARASARAHETSVRVALGATRGRLGRQLLSDSVLLSMAGGALGVLLAFWTANVLPALLYDVHAEHLEFSPDAGSIVGAAVACAVVLVACGLLPLFETRDDRPAAVLQREAAGPSGAMLRLRSGLVIVQMAGCCLLLISTGLLFEGFRAALRTGAGDRLGQPILATLHAERGFDRPDLGLDYFRRAQQAVLSLPGISETAWVDTSPGASPVWSSVRIEPPDLPLRHVEMDVVLFTPRSHDTVVLPPVAGRMFGGGDLPDSCKVAIVNEEAADGLFDGDAVARSMEDPAGDRVEIIGVVATRRPEGAAVSVRPAIYYYERQTGDLAFTGPGTFRVPDRPTALASGVLDARIVSPEYFSAMGFSTMAGTTFQDEPRPEDCRVGVINQEAAELYFGGHAVGGAVIDPAGRRTGILGVVQSAPLRAAQRRTDPSIYAPMTQEFVPRMTLIAGTRKADEGILGSVRRRLETISGGDLVPGGVVTLDGQLARTALAPERIATLLVAAAAVTALALGVLGIYGAMAELARQRRREFALRVALGAQRWRVTVQVLAAGVRLAGAGILAGVLGSVLVARWLAGIAPGVDAAVIWVWLAGPLVLLGAVVLASALPARRAQMVDPLTIMRDK